MPLRNVVTSAPGNIYARPFEGPVDHRSQGIVDITTLTNAEIDAQGNIKPGVPMRQITPGVFGLVNAAGQAVWGVTMESIKAIPTNGAADIAAGSTTFPLVLATI